MSTSSQVALLDDGVLWLPSRTPFMSPVTTSLMSTSYSSPHMEFPFCLPQLSTQKCLLPFPTPPPLPHTSCHHPWSVDDVAKLTGLPTRPRQPRQTAGRLTVCLYRIPHSRPPSHESRSVLEVGVPGAGTGTGTGDGEAGDRGRETETC